MASVVGKTIFSDGKGKLFFGYYKTDDAVEFVDYKTWKKLSFKDVSKGDTNKERAIKAILKNQKQFNKKVDFNMWAKKQKRSFEDTMDWFIQNGWISNINKGGIREGVEDVLSVNESAEDAGKAIIPAAIKIRLQKAMDVLDGKKLTYQQKIKVLGKVIDSLGIDKSELNKISQKIRTKLESVNESKQEVIELKKKVGNNETKFYDILSTVEKKYGKNKYRIWLEKSLKQFGENPKHYDYRTNAAVEEKLFQLAK